LLKGDGNLGEKPGIIKALQVYANKNAGNWSKQTTDAKAKCTDNQAV